MGRRKIEIKAIKDDRNRSVTFLKRKGGLFKKAHELSVLCSVDVAVIIFGHNKKLYEFSSGDINETIGRYQYYGGAHEHKGPEDFMGKKDVDDDEDDEDAMASPQRDSHTPPEQQHGMMPHHLQNQAAFQHIRHQTPSASPPMPNGLPFHHRHPSPQPTGVSRPNSRAHIRRPSSNLVPPQHQQPSQAPPPANNYAYMPNPPFYQGPPPPAPPQPLSKPPAHHHQQQQQNAQYQQYSHPPPTHPQVQQFMQQQQEPRRQSMPPTFPQERPQTSVPVPSPPHPEQQQQQQQQQQFQSPPMSQPKALPPAAKHSIFTPIEDSRSMLALHWGSSNSVDQPRPEGAVKVEGNGGGGGGGVRSQSIDVASISRPQVNGNSPPQATAPPQQQQHQHSISNPQQQPPQRTQSTSSVPTIAPPSRSNSMQTDPKRPRLKVQIPSEHSDGGSATAESSPNKESGGTTTGATPARTSTDASHSSGVLLPPPSPSANSLLSAGASGPPNPFARPHPPPTNGSYGSKSEMETPISALPSRFVENGLLPSPSSFYPEWGFGRENNMLPSPLTFQTPVVPNGPNFGRDDATERKRKTSEGSDGGGSTAKRAKA